MATVHMRSVRILLFYDWLGPFAPHFYARSSFQIRPSSTSVDTLRKRFWPACISSSFLRKIRPLWYMRYNFQPTMGTIGIPDVLHIHGQVISLNETSPCGLMVGAILTYIYFPPEMRVTNALCFVSWFSRQLQLQFTAFIIAWLNTRASSGRFSASLHDFLAQNGNNGLPSAPVIPLTSSTTILEAENCEKDWYVLIISIGWRFILSFNTSQLSCLLT